MSKTREETIKQNTAEKKEPPKSITEFYSNQDNMTENENSDEKSEIREYENKTEKPAIRKTDKPVTNKAKNVKKSNLINNYDTFIGITPDKNSQEKYTFIGNSNHKIELAEIQLLFLKLGKLKVTQNMIFDIIVSEGLEKLKQVLEKDLEELGK